MAEDSLESTPSADAASLVGTIVEPLRRAIAASPWTLSEIGRRSGTEPANLSRFVRGDDRQLGLKSAERVAAVLGLRLGPRRGAFKPTTERGRLGRALEYAGPATSKERRSYTDEDRGLVFRELEGGATISDAAQAAGVTRSAAAGWAKRWRDTGELPRKRPRRDRG